MTKVPAYPLPRVQQAIDSLQGKDYFFTFDLRKACRQIPIEKEHRKYLAFITPDGLYEWLRMPFGIAGAPATQQRMMDKLLAGMKWICALAYLDNILIYSNTFTEHLAHLEALFNKSTLCARETSYLGFLVSAKGVRPDPNKIKPVMELPEPQDRKGVRTFLGTGSYYRRFIKNYAIRAAPLQALLSGQAL